MAPLEVAEVPLPLPQFGPCHIEGVSLMMSAIERGSVRRRIAKAGDELAGWLLSCYSYPRAGATKMVFHVSAAQLAGHEMRSVLRDAATVVLSGRALPLRESVQVVVGA